jgi:hypothetical protein
MLLSNSGIVEGAVLPSFAQAGDDAVATLSHVFYASGGFWQECNRTTCRRANGDWGVDSAIDALFLRWKVTGDPSVGAIASAELAGGPQYPAPCGGSSCPAWSDTPAWDAVAFMREYAILGHNQSALARAESAFRYAALSPAFVGGACPAIPYQLPGGPRRVVKTLETDANVIKAALLIYDATRDPAYLDQARSRYDADRRYFLDSDGALYTVKVLDDGTSCVQQPRHFFASVNGDMIWNGIQLWRITGRQRYYDEAVTTASAVDVKLSDGRGVFVDLAGANDVVEPLVDAMYDLATRERLSFARDWIVRNATAALAARAPDGTFSRYFDGPPQAMASLWESNGGLALEIVAAGLAPDATLTDDGWQSARMLAVPLTELPATFTFDGSGIALVGKIGTVCEAAHLRVFIDGAETFDRTGLWQNHSMPSEDAVRFAWRWPTAGRHTIRLEANDLAPLGPAAIDLKILVLGAGTM